MTQDNQSTSVSSEELTFHDQIVLPEWIDYNGHMNLAYYLLVFDHALDTLFDQMDLGISYRNRENCSLFTVETHITYGREVLEGEQLRVESRILGFDAKRLHLFNRMFHVASGDQAATNEVMLLHVDMATRRTADFSQAVIDRIAPAYQKHCDFDIPDQAGRSIVALKSLV